MAMLKIFDDLREAFENAAEKLVPALKPSPVKTIVPKVEKEHDFDGPAPSILFKPVLEMPNYAPAPGPRADVGHTPDHVAAMRPGMGFPG